jgi:hypothetical protein
MPNMEKIPHFDRDTVEKVIAESYCPTIFEWF